MFTGIVEAVGEIREMTRQDVDMRLRVQAGGLDCSGMAVGDSVSVSGACLTAAEVLADGFRADVSRETLDSTALGDLEVGSKVNLERSLTPSSRLGGHLVTGHVDGVGEVTGFRPEGRSWRLAVRAPEGLARYIARKGSICVDGVSLTVNDVDGAVFGVNVVPHTLAVTTIGDYRPGCRVNLEVDIIARYLERLLAGVERDEAGGLTLDTLARHGFLK